MSLAAPSAIGLVAPRMPEALERVPSQRRKLGAKTGAHGCLGLDVVSLVHSLKQLDDIRHIPMSMGAQLEFQEGRESRDVGVAFAASD